MRVHRVTKFDVLQMHVVDYLVSYGFLASLVLLSSDLCCGSGSRARNITSTVARQIRSIGFPDGSAAGIFFAIGIPLEIPDKSVTFSFYFEANYGLPNSSDYYYYGDYWKKRRLDRSLTYEIVESKFKSAGFPGRSCLLRTICEITKNPILENGLVGDILRIIFTPSSSKDENLPSDINEAEHTEDCLDRFQGCPINLLDHISI
ncbi:uncharacterized protein LOC105701920 [Orussus abietinus]|uniref:uncharacterized protein LOC105701920 n=1 Tax=Orussus abietinus TaxID=222816 RepID=UPI00062616C8|nr:uncharacterized protein LOC105701920 [Orussus abietinus]